MPETPSNNSPLPSGRSLGSSAGHGGLRTRPPRRLPTSLPFHSFNAPRLISYFHTSAPAVPPAHGTLNHRKPSAAPACRPSLSPASRRLPLSRSQQLREKPGARGAGGGGRPLRPPRPTVLTPRAPFPLQAAFPPGGSRHSSARLGAEGRADEGGSPSQIYQLNSSPRSQGRGGGQEGRGSPRPSAEISRTSVPLTTNTASGIPRWSRRPFPAATCPSPQPSLEAAILRKQARDKPSRAANRRWSLIGLLTAAGPPQPCERARSLARGE